MSIGGWLDRQFTGTPNPKGGTDYLGGLVNYQKPAGPSNNFGLFGATLKDIGANLGGRPEDAQNLAMFGQQQQQQTAQLATQQARTALQQALATGDTAKIRTAALGYASAGGDLGSLMTAMKFGQPSVEHVGDNLVQFDPMNPTSASVLYHGSPPAPAGYSANLDGSLKFMKGGPADPATIGTAAAIRRQAVVDRPTPARVKPTAPNSFGVVTPWQQFGGK